MSGFSLPPSPSDRRRRTERRRAIGLLLGAVAILIAIGGVFLSVSLGRVELDEETLCPKAAPSTRQTAVLLDVTDPLNEVQRAFVERWFEDLRARLALHDELSLYALRNPGEARLEPEIRLCNPGSGTDASWLWQNPERIQRRWSEDFHDPLSKLFQEALSAPPAPRSPIMEQIQAASVTAFDARAAERQLVIVSDMLQHSSTLSLYRGGLDFERFQRSAGYERARCRLPGVKVRILYVQRESSPFRSRPRPHVEFWQRYFEDCGAILEEVEKVPGLG